jgi:phosphoserine phosphatase
MKLLPGEMRLLDEIRQAGPDRVLWTSGSSTTAGRVLRKGLIECRVGTLTETKDGRKTGIRYFAVERRNSLSHAIAAEQVRANI